MFFEMVDVKGFKTLGVVFSVVGEFVDSELRGLIYGITVIDKADSVGYWQVVEMPYIVMLHVVFLSVFGHSNSL